MASQPSVVPRSASDAPHRSQKLIEIGWLISRDVKKTDRDAVIHAHQRMLARLREEFPQFDWRMPLIRQPISLEPERKGSVMLLYESAYEKQAQHWDYAFVISGSDLHSYYKPFAFAMPSKALAVTLISTARLASPSLLVEHDDSGPECKAQRLYALSMHLLGDLVGLEHCADPHDFMYVPRDSDELDGMVRYSEAGHERLARVLENVADLRLEEQPNTLKKGIVAFYGKAIWLFKKDIVTAVLQAKPWEFPFRLSRLTTAAISTLLILMMTAEAWDLGMSQPVELMGGFSLLVLLGTSVFVLKRQKLLLHRSQRRLAEQIVVTNVAITLIVLMGMAITYGMLFATTLGFAHIMFDYDLVASWAESLDGQVELRHYLSLAQLTASLGILIGALGASFEGQEYFRHVAYVDEEL